MRRVPLVFLSNLWQQKSTLLIVFCVAVSVGLLAKVVMKYVWTYQSTIALMPATKAANTALQTVVERYNSSHTLSKLRVYASNTVHDSTRGPHGEEADFVVVSPGQGIPNNYSVVAALNEEKVIVLSHKSNRFTRLTDIRDAVIHIVHVHDYDELVLKKVFTFFHVDAQKNTINSIPLDTFLASKIVPKRVVYAFFLNPFSAAAEAIFRASGARVCDACSLIEIDLATLAEEARLFFSVSLKKGEVRMRPLLPVEDLDTVSAFTYLVARASVRDEVVYRLLSFLYASRQAIQEKVAREVSLTIDGLSE